MATGKSVLRIIHEMGVEGDLDSRILQEEINAMSYSAYLKSDVWKRFRTSILGRDGHKCQHCGSSDDLQVHHHHYETLKQEMPEDVITLCGACHLAEESWIEQYGRRWIPYVLQENVAGCYAARKELKKYGYVVNAISRGLMAKRRFDKRLLSDHRA